MGLLILLTTAFVLLVALLTVMLMWEMTHPPRHTAAYAIARNMATSPDDAGLPFESWMLDRPDGARLPVWDARRIQPGDAADTRENFEPPRPTAIFLHGWGHSRID